MTALELIIKIEALLEKEKLIISTVMYDPDKLQDKVSIAVFDDVDGGHLIKKYLITVDKLR